MTKHLMIVDDSRVSRMMIKSQVQSVEPNWQIHEAEDAEDALNQVKEKQIDFFSIDLNMPGRDGFALIEQLKPHYAEGKFVLFTANIQSTTHDKAKTLGVNCINKPITQASVKQMLEFFYD